MAEINSKSTNKNKLSASSGKKSQDQDEKPKPEPKRLPVTKNMICNPTKKAERITEVKKTMRAMDYRDPNNFLWQMELQRHTQAIDRAKAHVDTSAPAVTKKLFEKVVPYNNALVKQSKIEAENAALLRNLAAIYNGEIKSSLNTKLNNVQQRAGKNIAFSRALKTMEVMRENMRKYEKLQNIKSTYSVQALSKWYEGQKQFMDQVARYPSRAYKVCPMPLRRVMEKAYENPRQFAYLLVEVEDKQAENLVIELYADLCPFTVKNFQKLCRNTKATACDCRTYRCKKIERLHSVQVMDGGFKKLYWMIGEEVDSTVEYSQMMVKESSNISHTEAGFVTRPKGRAGGAFFITAAPCVHLDAFCYVFGKVEKKGVEFLDKLVEQNTEKNGSTIIPVHITDCGVVATPDDVPPPMLLHDFIAQARFETQPMTQRDPYNPNDWKGEKSQFAKYMKEKAKEGKERHDQLVTESRILAVPDREPDD